MFEEIMNVFSWAGMCVMVVGIILTSKVESKYIGKHASSQEPASGLAMPIDSEGASPA